ncbi:mycofactocin system glycosyltransferase [Geodermatophilus tzadiensis]|uniref:Mycofactocin system glycosyltransferase n=1 Tax=Geodermatophilus tzadiensis TaxID=1137988 RepID=A0A2T0T6E7_9ACTN|nr:mycofactocin biosynthesis glycosyltransferase MftF [Geodermatophilus tzadiensis]PRY41238.1 mycofactocin system glycosyltransferase [Geodermatophilus tzadiensis]
MTAVPPPPDARLPDGYAVRLAPGTRRREDGAVLLGGSPLRLLRLSSRARTLLAGDRLTVTDASSAALAGRLLDTGVATPEPAGPAPGPADVTVVVPVRDRADGVARLLAALRADPVTAGVRVLVVDDGSADPAALAAAATGAEVLRHERSRGPAAARDTGLRAATTAAVAFLDSDCVPEPGWLAALLPHLADPRLALVAPRVTALPSTAPGWVTPYETAVSALDMGPAPARVAPLSGLSYVPSAALLARRAALGEGFDPGMRVAEDVDLVWRLTAAGWRVRYEPAARVAHDHPSTTGSWLRRRAVYGTGAAPLAARHGSLVAPVVVSPWTAAALVPAVAGGRPGRVLAAGVLGAATVRLARRLAGPGRPAPYGLAAALVVRGSAAGARTLARAATRHHWPLAAAAALVSRRARRGLAVLAVADAVLGWLPHRGRVGLLRFAAARRLEDLAYGAGLWAGALRARDARALLPARPPDVAPPRPR